MPSKRPPPDPESDHDVHGPNIPVAESSTASIPTRPKKQNKPDAPTAGIVYISRLPPGMTPQKVRHLMARWGEVGRVYAQRRDAPTGYGPQKGKQRQKHASANFSEAWVEFAEKNVAKTVARMLNAEVIGGKKGDRWRDDIWTMQYLSGFKWEMLGEQVAYERQAHQSRLRAEIARSKTEQGDYLRNVELARVLAKRRARKAATETGQGGGAASGAGEALAEVKSAGGDGSKKGYKQRQVAERGRGMEGKGMESVLASVFG